MDKTPEKSQFSITDLGLPINKAKKLLNMSFHKDMKGIYFVMSVAEDLGKELGHSIGHKKGWPQLEKAMKQRRRDLLEAADNNVDLIRTALAGLFAVEGRIVSKDQMIDAVRQQKILLDEEGSKSQGNEGIII